MSYRGPLPPSTNDLGAFCAAWAEALDVCPFPAFVLDLVTGQVCWHNSAAEDAGGGSARLIADLLPAEVEPRAIVAALSLHGAWHGPLRDGTQVAAAAVGAPGEVEGLVFLAVPEGRDEVPDGVALTEGAASPFLLVDRGLRVLYANAAARAVLPAAPEGRLLVPLTSPAVLAAAVGERPASDRVDSTGATRLWEWRRQAMGHLVGLWGNDVSARPEVRGLLERRLRSIEAMHEASSAAARALPAAELAQVVAVRLARVVPARDARVSLLDGDTLRLLAWLRDGAALPTDGVGTLLSSSPASHARATRMPVQTPTSHASQFPALFAFEAAGLRSALFVPLRVEEAIFGFVELYGEPFSESQVDFAQEMASILSAALVRERLMDQISRHAHAMEQRLARGSEELHRTNEQLLQAARLSSIGELAAGLVHELNQPLNVVGGYIELLAEGSLPPPARARALGVMARAIQRMTVLADNLRTFARADASTMAPVDLHDVATMARDLTAGAVKRGVEIVHQPGVVVFGSATQLEQVLINLVANALQADGDPVTIRVVQRDECAIVEVADRGPGVPPALRERIFDAFFTTKPPGLGTGLGLSVSARIVQEHGGRIEVHDEPEGGALFRVVLPLLKPRS